MSEINNYGDIYYPSKNNSAVVKCMLSGRTWEKKIVKIFREHVNKDDVVLDVGTYIGLHTIELSKLAKHVISFEPQPLISACVRKTLNAMEIKNVDHHHMALGNDTGWTYIHTNGDGDASIRGIRDAKFNQSFKCKIDKLDNIVKEKVKLIKIDVEGHEWEVLAGAINLIEEHKPIIIIETFKTKKNLLELKHFCECMDYSSTYISADNYLLVPI
tara:strand:+ start:70 stop:714 length:645 start_codon:yes stop_codon:yes gene_type:complete